MFQHCPQENGRQTPQDNLIWNMQQDFNTTEHNYNVIVHVNNLLSKCMRAFKKQQKNTIPLLCLQVHLWCVVSL